MRLPAALGYCLHLARYRRRFRSGRAATVRLSAPVIVVGNITVGGTGKTPVVQWLVGALRERGWRPGIISRGYGGEEATEPRRVPPDGDPARFGDEPVLLARETGCPVAVCPDRPTAGRLLLDSGDCDCLVADDGLQHLALERDIELVVVDGQRGFGNGLCYPAGPLREPRARLRSVDLVITNGGGREGAGFRLEPGAFKPVDGREGVAQWADFSTKPVHAVAAIGNPDRFFRLLEERGLRIERHAFPDHHPFSPDDLDFGDGHPVLMTAKDAVKCAAFAPAHYWYLPVRLLPDAAMADAMDRILDGLGNPPDN